MRLYSFFTSNLKMKRKHCLLDSFFDDVKFANEKRKYDTYSERKNTDL